MIAPCKSNLRAIRETNANKSIKVYGVCMAYGRPTECRPWALVETQNRPFLKRTLALGINFFDTADVYTQGASEKSAV